MADSVHLSRWLNQFQDSEHEFRIVSSSPHRRIHPQLQLLLSKSNYSISLASKLLSLPMWLADRFLSDWLRGLLIASEASRFKADLVHVLEFQNGGYPYLRARSVCARLRITPLLLTPYGSDIFWFQRFQKHRIKIQNLLKVASAFSSECRRDELLATELGFQGKFMPRIPAFGNVPVSIPSPDRSNRDTIAVKGYQYSLGQALNAMKAIEAIADDLRDFKIVFFSCNRKTITASKAVARRTGLSITCYPKFALTNEEMFRLFSRSVAYVGLSKSDGISASMIEAMANGAIPIQSNSSCGGEWLQDGVGGFLVDYQDINTVARLLASVVRDEDFQRAAAKANFEALTNKLNPDQVQRYAELTYRGLAEV
jgi:hypothetical protein